MSNIVHFEKSKISETANTAPTSANNVIRFNHHRADPQSLERQETAIGKLAAAIECNRISVARFRANNEELRNAMGNLKAAFLDFQRNLDRINVRGVQRKSMRLANIMESHLNTSH